MAGFDTLQVRAKTKLSNFLVTCNRNMTFKQILYEFINGIEHIKT